MAKKPILLFPAPRVAVLPATTQKAIAKPQRPTAAEQKARLDSRFEAIANSFSDMAMSAPATDPEQVIVLEAIDSVKDVAKAAENIPGMEWLAELDLEDADPEFGFQSADEKNPDKKIPQRLYAVMTNQSAISQILSLWNTWTAAPDSRAESGLGPFKSLFLNLRDIRRWNHKDRLFDTGILEDWRLGLEYQQDDIRFEVELWHRDDAAIRKAASTAVRRLLARFSGNVIHEVMLPEIRYHGLLVKLPGSQIQQALDSLEGEEPVELVRCQEVMFFRPHGQARFGREVNDDQPAVATQLVADLPTGSPVVALLDGLPMENHAALAGRLLIDDPDDHSAMYESDLQQHGTTMASLICRGDLAVGESPLSTPVYVRPILQPDLQPLANGQEVTPPDRLIVDLIHQAVRRIKEGDGNEAATAPSVCIINLSIGIPSQPFVRQMSPLARLLDWLSWKYRVLFIVSAGNHLNEIQLDCLNRDWSVLDQASRTKAVLKAIRSERPNRQPLSPAESLNSITVGSCHDDGSQTAATDQRIDLMGRKSLPSPYNPVASGFRRTVTPDVMLPGGRLLYDLVLGSGGDPVRLRPSRSQRPPGNQVAVPGVRAFELDRLEHTRGTSNAAALASRLGAMIHERLMQLRQEPFGDRLEDNCLPVLIKAMLVHGASWNDGAAIIDDVFRDTLKAETGSAQKAAAQLAQLQTAFLGYGAVSAERSLFSTDERITFLGCGGIQDNFGHTFRFPLPAALAGKNVKRRVTYTLAWLTPINLRHSGYRKAKLKVEWPQSDPLQLKVAGAKKTAAQRGTVEHHVREGTKIVAFGDEHWLEITVACKADAGDLAESIPYALAVSLEIAEPLGVSIFEEVRERVRERIGEASE